MKDAIINTDAAVIGNINEDNKNTIRFCVKF